MARRTCNPPRNASADVRINDLIQQAQASSTTNLRSSLAAATDALRLARAHGMEAPAADALHLIAKAQVLRGKSALALHAATEACELYQSLGDHTSEATALITTSVCLRRLDRIEEARQVLHKSMAIAVSEELPDTRVEALCGFGYAEMSGGNIEAGREYLLQSIEQGNTIGTPAIVADAMQAMGISYYITSEWRKAIEWYEQGLAVARPTGNLSLIARTQCNMTVSMIHAGDIAGALRLGRRTLRMLEQLDDLRAIGITLLCIATAARSLGEYDTALTAQIRSIAIAEQLQDWNTLVLALNNLGEIYEKLGDPGTALEHFTRAYNIAREIGNRPLQVILLKHIVENHHRLGIHSRALTHALYALRLARQAQDANGEQIILQMLGWLYLEMGSLDDADATLQRGLSLARATATPEHEARILNTMADVAERRGQLTQAYDHMEQAYAVASANHHQEFCHELLERLAGICERMGDSEQSARYHHALQQSTATIFSPKRIHRIRRRVAEFELQAYRAEARQLQLNEHEIESAGLMVGEELERRLWKLQTATDMAPRKATQHHAATRSKASADPVQHPPRYRVEALGSLRLWVSGTEITGRAWGRKRARDLFKLLLVRYRRPVTIDEIIELLWDGNNASGTELLVMNTISHLRRVLEPDRRPHAPSRVIPGINRTYLLDLGDDAVIDILQFKEAIASARQSSGTAEEYEHLQRAIALHGDDLLKEDYYAEWAASEREQLKDDYLAALESVGDYALQRGETDTALSSARELLRADPTSIEGYRIMIAALRHQGREREIAALHEQCRDAFEREYGPRSHVHISKLFSHDTVAA